MIIPWSPEDLQGTISSRFRKVLATCPDETAILRHDGSRITFRELDQQSHALACALLERDSNADNPVALLFNDMTQYIVALLSVFKLGRCAVPLDISHPPQRLGQLAAFAGVKLFLADEAGSSIAHGAITEDDQQVIDCSRIPRAGAVDDLPTSNNPLRLADIFFTSGSTGRPKAVLRGQIMEVRYTHLTQHDEGRNVGDRLSLLFSNAFAAAMGPIVDTFMNGTTICPFPLKQLGFRTLVKWIEQQQINVLYASMGVMREIMHATSNQQELRSVRTVLIGGEAALPSDVVKMRQIFREDARILCRYGSTEATLIASFEPPPGPFTWPEPTIPIGAPHIGNEIFLVDNSGAVIDGVGTGEIAIRKEDLAMGYLHEPELTAARFVPASAHAFGVYLTGDRGRRDEEGRLWFAGREDGQVKIGGYLVNVAEVESALSNLPGVRQCAARVFTSPSGTVRLAGFVVMADGSAPLSSAAWRSALRTALPEYLIPSAVVTLEAMPRNNSDKVDRAVLPDPWQRLSPA